MTKKNNKKPTRKRTTITKKIIKDVKELARLGFNNSVIAKVTGVATVTLSKNSDLRHSIHEGKIELSKEVTSSMLDTLKDNATNQQFLVKRLGLFNREIDIKKPKTAKEALNNLGIVIELYSKNLVSESQVKTIEATCNSFIKAYEAIDLEERLTRLEKIIGDKKS